MAEESPAITVVIPTYKSSGTLRLALETVLLQDFHDFEVRVVGDACTDDSEAVVSSFKDKRLKWTNLSVNSGGPGLPRNEALRRAKGQFIAYLGHDDLWLPWHLSGLVDCIEKSNSGFVYSLGLMLGPSGVVGTFTLPEEALNRKGKISPSNWLHRKDIIDTVGFWSQDRKIFGHDCEFLHRVQAADVRFGFQQQLSVLKFPSVLWRMYSLVSDFPQTPYVEAMRSNASGLRLELLTAAAASQSGVWQREGNFITGPLRALARRFYALYGYERWPLRNFLQWRWQRMSGLTGKKQNSGRQ
jgi:glycosyltransferase involved in cell wall biosynthesis